MLYLIIIKKIFCFILGDNTSFLRHRVRWIFNAIKTNAVITPDPCDDKKRCLLDESDGKSYIAEVLVGNTLPNVRFRIYIHLSTLLTIITDFFHLFICLILDCYFQIRGTMMWVAERANNVEVICFKIPIIVTINKK